MMVFSALLSQGFAASPSQPFDEDLFRSGEALTVSIPLDTHAVFNGSYPIDSLGYAEIPVVGKILVGDRKTGDVEEFLSKKLGEYLRDPHLTVTPSVRLTFLGHWVHPGMYFVSPKSTVWDLFRGVGGPTDEANLEKIRVMRGSQIIPLDVLTAFSSGANFRTMGLRSGDIIIIPIPSDKGFWYWFRESLSVTAQFASVAATLMTAYITYIIYTQGPAR